jgi:hypothetical protein
MSTILYCFCVSSNFGTILVAYNFCMMHSILIYILKTDERGNKKKKWFWRKTSITQKWQALTY